MKLAAALLALVFIAGCGVAGRSAPLSPEVSVVQEVPPAPAVVVDPRPNLLLQSPTGLTRDEVRAGLVRLMNEPGAEPEAQLQALFPAPNRYFTPHAVPWLVADLDGDGTQEYALTLSVVDPSRPVLPGQGALGAALFVIYRRDGQWAVDRTDPLTDRAEQQLTQPELFAVADLSGSGHPQIVWLRQQSSNTGPHPTSVFVTSWQPGVFTQLPGEMAISSNSQEPARVALDGPEIVLTGGSRQGGFLFTMQRSDRYRFVRGALRLVDRSLTDVGTDGYSRLWAGLFAEDVGRTGDAERSYQEAADPRRPTLPDVVYRYAQPPLQLTPAELAAFAQALQTFARFRLGALLQEAGHTPESDAMLKPAGGPYDGLLRTMQQAASRKEGCQAATAWADAHPEFLAALNSGVGDHRPWVPETLCTHASIEDFLR